MWKEYSSEYIKSNRASGIAVMIAAFISALLLSLLGCLAYNLWTYEIEHLKEKEGDWQGRLTGELGRTELDRIQGYANVEKVVINEELSEQGNRVADIYFKNRRSIFEDMPRIAELAGLPAEAVTYHYALLNLYLIRDSGDTALRWVFPFFLAVVAVACLSLVLVIHNAFAVTMNARIHQFGIFSSIGATPGQIRSCLLQEAFGLCMIPVLAGNLLGILVSMGILEGIDFLLGDVKGRMKMSFGYHPLIFLLTLAAAIVTIWISAWIPAKKLSRLTPLEAIRNTGELRLKRRKNSRILSLLFGVEGELAGNALKAQRKAMRTGFLSLTLSFFAFSFMMCFLTLAVVSQNETYFERYQEAWDVMAAVKDTELEDFREVKFLQELSGIQSCVAYQKAAAKRIVAREELSREMTEAGGFENASSDYVTSVGDAWLVNAPLVIMDDAGFLEYCEQIGVEPQLSGAVILNKTVDATDPNFRNRREFPYLSGSGQTTLLTQGGQEELAAEVPVLAYLQVAPVLREEYGTLDFYELVHFIPVSLWREIKDRIGSLEEDVFIRVLAEDGASLEELNEMEREISRLLGQDYEVETENRIQDRLNNDKMIGGMKAILSVFCILLAVIGVGNVFSNTLGFVRQRKREFARLLSVGMTPNGMKKIFWVEVLVIAGKPVLFTLPVTIAAVAVFLKISYLEPMLFMREVPFVPILVFFLAILGFVGFAYYLGAKKVFESDLVDSLRDDTVL